MAGCSSDVSPPPPTPGRSSVAQASRISFGAYGTEDELTAYRGVVDVFNSLSDRTQVSMRTYPDHDTFEQDARAGHLPDVFMATRRDLAWLLSERRIQPVDASLVERGLDFGDGYSRDGLLAFSANSHLECMPYGISPMVLYYNTKLIDFTKMAAKGFQVPVDPTAWSFDAFAAAAEFASRPSTGAKGVYIDPTIRGLAPFIYSGGGQVFDDTENPTSLAFSDDSTRAALERTLEVLRNPHVTLTDQQLRKHSALEWFERGKLGMIEGFRDLTPVLRQVQGLNWDVIAMPTLGSARTVGDITGLCISRDATDLPGAADFLVHMASAPAVRRVVSAGSLVPANQAVALSDDFRQPGRLPHHPEVFNNSVRGIVDPPLLQDFPALEASVAASIHKMLTVPIIGDLSQLTQQIDEESRSVLSPDTATESPSPSDSASSGSSSSPTG
jgi:multiple sugar transport system substrate-binding protein